ncbi:MAG TPA: DNA repair protein RadA, partial [Firmicutes bacterium]|nr:DNA repair protein RadA [Bacillota bacterium]
MRKGSLFICESCAYEAPKWLGKCPSCGDWNTFIEQKIEPPPAVRRAVSARAEATPLVLAQEESDHEQRLI